MMVHQICAAGREIAAQLRDAEDGREVRAIAADLDKLMNLLAASLDARVAETKSGDAMRPKFESGRVVVDGRVITAETLFKRKLA